MRRGREHDCTAAAVQQTLIVMQGQQITCSQLSHAHVHKQHAHQVPRLVLPQQTPLRPQL